MTQEEPTRKWSLSNRVSRRTFRLGLALALATGLFAAPPAQGDVHTQLQAVKDLASRIFNVPGVAEPASPCTGDPCNGGSCPQLSSGTPNMKLLARTWYYGWALRNGSTAEKQCARNYMNWFFDTRGVLGPVFWVQNRSGQAHDSGAYAGTPVDPPVKPANFATLFAPVSCPDCAGLVSGAVSCPASNALSP